MTTISFDESLDITMRTYLSMNYLTSAAVLAKKAHAIEAGRTFTDRISGTERDEHFAYVAGAITMSAAAIEAFVNELFADCTDQGDRNLMGIALDRAARLAKVWKKSDFQRDATIDKYDRALREMGLPRLYRKGEPFQGMETLIALRNKLMHYKLITRKAGASPGAQKLNHFEKKLSEYFGDNPLTGPGNAYFPDRVIGHGAAEWSVKVAVAFLDGFCQLLSVAPPYEHLRSTFATR